MSPEDDDEDYDDELGPHEWSPRTAPWTRAGHQVEDFEDDLSWLAFEAARKGLYSYGDDHRHEGATPSHFRFGKKFLKITQEMAKAYRYKLTPEQLTGLEKAVGAILTIDNWEPNKVEVYFNTAELRSDWYEIKDSAR